MNLSAHDFAAFFRGIHGCDPFPWQQELVRRLAACNEWPDVLDIPTGAGKTATLDAAVFHLALRADEPGRAALRIALVVDRRLVVDDAFARAEKVRRALSGATGTRESGSDVVAEVAWRLRKFAGDDAPPLVAKRLRGGAPLEHDWARTPTQPTILCSTVDQVGSRLLFRGYGVSGRMAPVHAGLLGTNCLVLLDEAHLSEAFRQTLDAVVRVGKASVKTVLLSATPGIEADRRLTLCEADYTHPVLRSRIEASKPTKLTRARGVPKDAFVKAAKEIAGRLRDGGVSSPVVGIVVNRVDLARGVFDALNADEAYDSLLMIGPSRDVDRNKIADRVQPFRTGAATRDQDKPVFVVATQCLEVGVDLDLDGLVTQCASFDAIRQRFGRLNRAGRPIPVEGAILALSDDVTKKADDPVYGDRIRSTWELLNELADGDTVDLGIAALDTRLRRAEVDVASVAAPRAPAPVIMPAYLHLWSQTSPRPAADPEVELFLHGADRSSPEVSVAWRSDITAAMIHDGLEELMKLVPTRSSETVSVPLWAARAWLRHGGTGQEHPSGVISDVPEREREVSDRSGTAQGHRLAFRWAGAGDPLTGAVSPDELRPGDLIVVPSEYGGCDEFGWLPHSRSHVEDVADHASEPFRGRRHAVRIARDVVDDDAQWRRISELLGDEGITGLELVERLLSALPSEEESDDRESKNARRSARESLGALRRTRDRRISVHPYPGGSERGTVLVAERGITDTDMSNDDATPWTENDALSHMAKGPVPVEQHTEGVVHFTKRFADVLGLECSVAADLRLAAFLHDAGKADRRFQSMLSGGDPWNRSDGPVLAKSGRRPIRGAWQRAGLPNDWRHEALSVRIARSHPRFADAHDPALVLWLIGTHHGLGRPFFGFAESASSADQELAPCLAIDEWKLQPGEPGPQSPAFEFEGADWPHLFDALIRRYGLWGLAHLETILRLADHRESELSEREVPS